MDINTQADAVFRRPIEVVNAVYEAYARRDLQQIATLYHRDCELMQTEELPWGGVYRGHAGLARFFERVIQTIDTQIVGETLIEAGNDVVSRGRTKGVAPKTGRAFELDAVHVYTIEDGRIRIRGQRQHAVDASCDRCVSACGPGWPMAPCEKGHRP